MDPAVYDTATHNWYIWKSSGGAWVIQWGFTGCIPLPYGRVTSSWNNNRRKIAVFYSGNNTWYVRQSPSSTSYFTATFGFSGAIPCLSSWDYGAGPIASYYPAGGTMYLNSSLSPRAWTTVLIGGSGAYPINQQYWINKKYGLQ